MLGLAPAAGLPEARAAFHALCKKYHPARFARSSPETVRLANEAFLAIKRAYDGLVRPDAPPSKSSDSIPKPIDSIPKPVADAPSGAARVPAATAPIPRVPPTTAKTPPVTVPIPRVPAERPSEKVAAPPRTQKLPAQPRPGTGGMPAQRLTPQELAAMTEEQRFTAALDLLRRRLWKDAEKALAELAVSMPAEKKYRAYRHYARGRMAQDEGRLDEARGEWERALRLDPDLAPARAAIDSLPEPPKPSGGLLSKLFKR